MGSIARVRVAYEDLEDFVSKNPYVSLYASTLDGKPAAAYGGVDEGFLVIGNESKGIREALIAAAKFKVTIPRFGKAESLNAAVATGILLSGMKVK